MPALKTALGRPTWEEALVQRLLWQGDVCWVIRAGHDVHRQGCCQLCHDHVHVPGRWQCHQRSVKSRRNSSMRFICPKAWPSRQCTLTSHYCFSQHFDKVQTHWYAESREALYKPFRAQS